MTAFLLCYFIASFNMTIPRDGLPIQLQRMGYTLGYADGTDLIYEV